ncbi:MipA/OmpV family protein [Rubellimicrobium aerolatum]|uniref:MipA/OmpV family protein n=1 Tax=Rubellimicrobium aerolatum TaxID=490979 RepID=A0ABW0SDM0_9RHOB|nr:MipA/OmpV family protein [Rubellimicrobium aerolatum]MBP1805784.1 outer membrane scaffolding protein for murein synthesis (MipA/OmpV family) [Rubellimicrobium aerolatum]
MIRPAVALLALLPLPALAQTPDATGPRLAFTLGAGIAATPGYFGSDEAEPGPDFTFSAGFLRFGSRSFGREDPYATAEGWDFRGSFRYVHERSGDDYEELEGLDDIDGAIEIGGGVSYARSWWEVLAVARYGVTGHESWVGEVGMDLISRPTDRLTLRAGPRLLLGTDDYAATYFGVSDAESAASGLAAYDASGGLLTSGVRASASYRLAGAWGLTGEVRYERLVGDAASSPITAEDDQYSASLLVTRRFTVRF